MCVLKQACMTQACPFEGIGVTQTLQPLLGYTEGSVVSRSQEGCGVTFLCKPGYLKTTVRASRGYQ